MLYTTFKVLISCAVIFSTVTSDPIDYSDCGSEYKIKQVDIEECRVIPCNVEIGKTYNIKITFEPTYTFNGFSQEVYIELFKSVYIPLNVQPQNPCTSLSCPLQGSNSDVTYTAKMFIGNNLVAAKGKLWWKMTSDSGRSAVCMKTSVQVVERKNNILFLNKW